MLGQVEITLQQKSAGLVLSIFQSNFNEAFFLSHASDFMAVQPGTMHSLDLFPSSKYLERWLRQLSSQVHRMQPQNPLEFRLEYRCQ